MRRLYYNTYTTVTTLYTEGTKVVIKLDNNKIAEFSVEEVWDLIKNALAYMEIDVESYGLLRRQVEAKICNRLSFDIATFIEHLKNKKREE